MTTGPNLVITSFTSDSAEAIPGGVVTFTFTVKNVGDASTVYPGIPNSGSSFTSLYKQGDPNKIDFVVVPVLEAGKSFTGTFEVDYSATFGGPAQSFYVVADDDGSVPHETNESDNDSPDIVIAAPSGGPLFTPNDDDATLPQPGTYNALAGNDIVHGTSGADIVRGAAGDEQMWGAGGADKLVGDNGNDWINGGAGDDDLRGGNGDDTILGMNGDDTMLGGPGADKMRGGDGDDVVKGRGGNDLLLGGPGADILRGGKHDDELKGGAGADKLYGGPGSDILRGQKHDDFVFGGGGDDRLFGGTGSDTVRGGRHDDRVAGGGGDDRLYGETGADTLIGGRGRDVLKGGGGDDTLTGGPGGDVFVFGTSKGTYTVTDFDKKHDKLDFDAFGMSDQELLGRFEQVGADAVLHAKGSTVVLLDVDVDDLGTGIFGSADDLLS